MVLEKWDATVMKIPRDVKAVTKKSKYRYKQTRKKSENEGKEKKRNNTK